MHTFQGIYLHSKAKIQNIVSEKYNNVDSNDMTTQTKMSEITMNFDVLLGIIPNFDSRKENDVMFF